MVKTGDLVYIHGREVDLPRGETPLPSEFTGQYLQVSDVISSDGFIHCLDSLGLPVKLYRQEYDIVQDKRKQRNLPGWF